MEMKDSEIVSKFKRSGGGWEQVNILAELNACDTDTIKKILSKGGIPEDEYKEAPKKRGRKAGVKNENRTPTKPVPAEANLPEDDKFPLPFSEDDMGEEENYMSGAITGGEGDLDLGMEYGYMGELGYEPSFKPYRTADELLKEPDDMTPEEAERLERIRAVPKIVREICLAELKTLHEQIMELEKKSDTLNDYLNGEAL